MRFIKKFRKEGTVILVSHDLNAIQDLCDEVIWLNNGHVQARGAAKLICNQYLDYTLSRDHPELDKLIQVGGEADQNIDIDLDVVKLQVENPSAEVSTEENLSNSTGFGGAAIEFTQVKLIKNDLSESKIFRGGEHVTLILECTAINDIEEPIFGFLFKNSKGVEIFGENTLHITKEEPISLTAGQNYLVNFSFVFPILPSGDYVVSVAVANGDFYAHEQLVWKHEACIVKINSHRYRYGILGLCDTEIAINKVS